MLPHPGNMSGFSATLFKAQLSTSQLRANLEREYQLVTHFVTEAVHEVSASLQGPGNILRLVLPRCSEACLLWHLFAGGFPAP